MRACCVSRRATHRTRGFTLLEVLIALLVLSLGLLGLAALQTLGLRFNQQSYQRTQAVIQAYDMLDRMRANPIAKAAGLYDNVAETLKPADPGCGNACSAIQRRDLDIRQWKDTIEKLLVEGTARIDTAPGSAVRKITINWKENDIPIALVVEAEV